MPLTVLRSFDAPPQVILDDAEALSDRIQSAVSGLLALLGIDGDPIRSREHILLSNILNQAWNAGQNLTLPDLIRSIQTPPFQQIGVFNLESFYPEKDRLDLALQINGVLASPGFASWLQGDPLDIGKLLYTPEGKPRIAVLSIAHLTDAERMFFVTILLNEVVAWMRTQPGTSSLRAMLYMDEIFGFFPPTANPPSKAPMLTLLKQARAYGLGVMLATQNPVDLDYKGLSNTGTWFIGRLQTERDKMRVLDGLEGASNTSGSTFNRGKMEQILAGLGSRVFLMHNVHDDAPVIFHTRWVMSYLRGPMTRSQIKTLMADKVAAAKKRLSEKVNKSEQKAVTSAGTNGAFGPAPSIRPDLPSGIAEFTLPMARPAGPGTTVIYRPRVLAVSRLHYVHAKSKLDSWVTLNSLGALPKGVPSVNWEKATKGNGELAMAEGPDEGIPFAPLPPEAVVSKNFKNWEKELKSSLYQRQWLKLWYSPELKTTSNANESEGEFRGRLTHVVREARDLEVEKLRKKYASKIKSAVERVRKAEQKIEKETEQYKNRKRSTLISIGTTVLGAFLGRKASSITGAGTAIRGAGSAAKEKSDIARAEEDLVALKEKYEELEALLQADIDKIEERLTPETIPLSQLEVRPRKTDIVVYSFGLAWTPWQLDQAGIAEPLFDLGTSD